ncbi:MAG: DUF4097 family beta strand repeat-containing protein [Roseiflexaceae bacterium]|nr:DUF4097 family beta strand repeat-containing protein [Roseiflexaceae bacterium]
MIIGLALLTLGLAWILVQVVGSRLSPGSQTLFDQIISGRRIEIDAGNADVTIIRWDRSGFRIQAQRVGWPMGKVDVAVRADGDTVKVSHRASCWPFCGEIRYQINAPAAADVRVTEVSGNVQIGALDSGITVNTTSGDVHLGGIGGSLAVNTVSGDVTLRGRVSNASIRTVSGAIRLSDIDGSLAVTTISGAITMHNVAGDTVRLQTTSGKVHADGALFGHLEIASVSGDVDIRLPPWAGFRLFIKTVSGDIEAPGIKGAPREWRATIGDGAHVLNIATTSGDVRIR